MNEKKTVVNEVELENVEEFIVTKVSPGTIARTVFMLITIANSALAIFGKEKLPFSPSEAEIYQAVSFAIDVAATVIVWWKNNSFTRPAQLGDWFKEQVRK